MEQRFTVMSREWCHLCHDLVDALRPLAGNVTKRLYAATREEDAMQPYMAHFLRLGRTEAVKLQRS